MSTTIAIVAIVIAVLIAAILGYAATRPDTFVVQRAPVSRRHQPRSFRSSMIFISGASGLPGRKKIPT